jgi:glucokinase
VIVGALELGGSHVSAARVDPANGRVEDLCRLPLDPRGSRSELLAPILDAARSIAAAVRRVGIAVPGPFDYERGICMIRDVGKLEALFGVDMRAELARVLPDTRSESISFLNDAEAFLLGEASAGAARGHARAMGVTLGTGLGSAFLVDGEIVREGPGVPPEGNLHVVPFRGGDVEDVISGRGITVGFDGRTTVAEIARLADDGDPRAADAFARLGRDLAEFLERFRAEFRPTCVVVGGSIARAWPHFEQYLSAEATRAARLDDAALVGAAVHALRFTDP